MNEDNVKPMVAESIRFMENEGKGRLEPLSLPEILKLLELLDENDHNFERRT